MKIRVAACQQTLNDPLSASMISQLQEFKPDYICLPEHYPLSTEIQNLEQAAERFAERKNYLTELSKILDTVVIGGTLTEKTGDGYYNTCYVFDRGKDVGFYRKVNPTSREQSAGVRPGDEFKTFEFNGLRVGVLICADVLFPESFRRLAALGSQIVFIPTASPYRPGESIEEKYERDRIIFHEGSKAIGAPLIKTCGVGTTFGHPIQGRSLIVTPEKIITRAEPDQEHSPLILTAELDVQ
ncbi:MAG TPA: carbon-nitrogen hydrolase family protein [Acidobacteriota bacterium]|nr:carbon-nitrogen hydrolase family protein [Acidobacteriota bacterium]